MENHGVIIQHLRILAKLTIQQTAKKIGKSVGWLSEIENNKGLSRLTEREFDRIIALLDGNKHRAIFKTWVANHKNSERSNKVFDGAVLRYIRQRKELDLKAAAKAAGLSVGYISKLETGLKAMTLEMRNRLMIAYGYSPSSFRNLSADPIRSRAVPSSYKLEILLNSLKDEQIEAVFRTVQNLLGQSPEIDTRRDSQQTHES
jgi:transcriptional regulator with XRE-family HTH domain